MSIMLLFRPPFQDSRTQVGKVASSAAPKLTPQEIMKRRMQAQLNKTSAFELQFFSIIDLF